MTNENKNKEFIQVMKEFDSLLESSPKLQDITIFSDLVVILKEHFDYMSWVGFYFYNEENKGLILGTFAGKLACNFIPTTKGVCGSSFTTKEVKIIDDVNKIPYHIACDSNSKSEIVLPLYKNNKLIGVLDIDSYELASFNEVDKKYLLEILNKINNY